MSDVITNKIIKPSDCVLAFGIPITREEFSAALLNPQNRDFVVNCCPDWRDYRLQIVSYMERLLPPMGKLGVSIVHPTALCDYRELFRQKQHSVIILFSHWKDDSVEFADGLAGVPAVVESVPPWFEGVIDLCVCHPKNLALELRKLRPDCVVKFTDQTATPALWLYFYLTVFRMLNKSDMTYLMAIEESISGFLGEG